MTKFRRPISNIMDENKLMQIEIFPQRLLNLDTAQKLLNELNVIDGINRMVVYGPGMPKDDPADLLDGKYCVREKKYICIMGEMVELTVQVGRIWIEVRDGSVVEKIREACVKTLPFPFELYEGLYLRTQKTITDYVRKGGEVDDIDLGMFDPGKCVPCCETLPGRKENDLV
ncbi:methyl-coenzyme M reductase operon protein D [Methanocella sp. CWC-04]|uniref:Methyl-coenzyme M reductase operon protein D n=1 Tax=Methanooceanicella nereidis TaxID=2052831 RepID=A0AAP2RDG6_9EURY|nr:methyl-coenzyme M reductase operon protein D [Methanocella sp. CWC-04]MCD1295298.1 methyl-coenzyme M reductase operon protein D [Methanocella sp. CWC-04]